MRARSLSSCDRPSADPRNPRGDEGLALVVTILVVALIGALAAAGVSGAMTALRVSSADYHEARAFYAAEAGAEAALSQLRLALRDGYLDDRELADMSPPELDGFEMELTVEKHGDVREEKITDGNFAGLFSLTQDVTITSEATDASGAHNALVLGAKAQAIPLFQFAVFFNGDGEDYAGSEKHILGRFHANGNLFLNGNGPLYFHEPITTPHKLFRDNKLEAAPPTAGLYVYDGSDNPVNIRFDSRDADFKSRSIDEVDARIRTDEFGVDSLKLPLPEGVDARELIMPIDEENDTRAERATKFAWQADMYVTVDLSQYGLHPRRQTCGSGSDQHPTISVDRPHTGAVPDDATKCEIFDWTFEAFFDYKELHWIDVLDVDIERLGQWIAENPTQNGTELIYVEFIDRPTGPPGQTDRGDDGYFPALRMRNGSQLPGPLTVGSGYPLYIWGDYNTGAQKWPAALFGDTHTVLSNRWSDASNPPTRNPRKPPAQDTRQVFALVTGTGEGHLGCYHDATYRLPNCEPVTPAEGRAGWTRLLEDWNSCGRRCIHTYRGSFVSLWKPQIATPYGSVPGSDYYKRPERDYSFDTDLRDPANLPPGTPNVGFVFRASFREVY